MDIKPIRTEEDYETALEEIERLFDSEPGTPEGDKLEVLTILVNAYEEEHYSIPLPEPIEAIEYHMERLGLSRRDLEPYIGAPSRISEILNRKRPLTMNMIRRLHAGLGIPIEILAQQYELDVVNEPSGFEIFPRKSSSKSYPANPSILITAEYLEQYKLYAPSDKTKSDFKSKSDAVVVTWRGSEGLIN